MFLALAPGIACCDCNGTAILLDVDRDRYFGLAPDIGRALLAFARGGSPDDRDRQMLEALVGRGILRHHADPCRSPILTFAPPIDDSVLDADDAWRPPDLRTVARTAASLGMASFRMRARSLASNLAAATKQAVA